VFTRRAGKNAIGQSKGIRSDNGSVTYAITPAKR